MKRSYLTLNLTDLNDLPKMNRWLFKDHAPDTVSQNGPILERYTTYRALPIPAGAEAYGAYNWRMTEHFWREDPFGEMQLDHGSAMSEIWCEGYNEAVGNPTEAEARGDWSKNGENSNAHPPAFMFCNYRPDNSFKGKGITLNDGPFFRFVVTFKYPDGVKFEEGEEWLLTKFAPTVCEQEDLLRAFSYKALPPYTGPFQRVLELWYRDSKAWRKNWVENTPKIPKPTWATTDYAPYLEPYKDMVCIFLEEAPERDFLRGLPYNVTS